MARCEVRWCQSGQKVTHHLQENMDDASFRFGICNTCWIVCGRPAEDSDHDERQQALLKHFWRASA